MNHLRDLIGDRHGHSVPMRPRVLPDQEPIVQYWQQNTPILQK